MATRTARRTREVIVPAPEEMETAPRARRIVMGVPSANTISFFIFPFVLFYTLILGNCSICRCSVSFLILLFRLIFFFLFILLHLFLLFILFFLVCPVLPFLIFI